MADFSSFTVIEEGNSNKLSNLNNYNCLSAFNYFGKTSKSSNWERSL